MSCVAQHSFFKPAQFINLISVLRTVTLYYKANKVTVYYYVTNAFIMVDLSNINALYLTHYEKIKDIL